MKTFARSLMLLLFFSASPLCATNLTSVSDTVSAQNLLGTEAPDFTLKDVYGKEIRLSSFKGKTVFINFFVNDYSSCMYEYPVLKEIVDEYKNKEIIFLNISVSDSSIKLLSFGKNFDKNANPFFYSRKELKKESKETQAYFAKGRFDLTPRTPNHYLIHRGKQIETGIPAPEIDPDGFYGSPFDPVDGYKKAEAMAVAKLYQATDYPTKIFVGKDGKIRYVTTGFVLADRVAIKQKYVEEINKLLAE